ncbi:MAG: tRNA lysidine(34) synthetase TilS [Proteobacteria bacterium]|nr:tRNA lysidine(34) synthetase TilS [Pseudomonadota bacterium]
MTFGSEFLLERLTALTVGEGALRWLVAFSGGIDSTVLLHALWSMRERHPAEIMAIHVDHGLHPDSPDWEYHCRRFAARLGVSYISERVSVVDELQSGLEAAARQARYALLQTMVRDGDCLLSAHHEEDQAETLLLNLMRGSGLAGLAGIGAAQSFGQGRLLRPLLGVSAEAIRDYAKRHELGWIEDPSNADTRFDRNFLRREIMPRLASRWPAVAARLKQSADLAGEASTLLRDLADIDLAASGSPKRLDIDVLGALSPQRQRNLLRRAISLCGLPPPPATRLYQAVDELIPARVDAQPQVAWPGAELRRYRNHLYIMPGVPDLPDEPAQALRPEASLDLGPGMGQLALNPDVEGGINPELASAGLRVRYRQGGEEIRPVGHDCTHKLKKLLQQEGIVPWMRSRLPLLYSGENLVAVADLWIAGECSHDAGYGVSWRDRSPLN